MGITESFQRKKTARNPGRFSDSSGSSFRASYTSRTARSRNSCGYFLNAGMIIIHRGIRPSTQPGAIHYGMLCLNHCR
jgi:hypothetical protein